VRVCAASRCDAMTLLSDQRGQTTVEWALLMAVVGIPLLLVFYLFLDIIAENYRLVTFLELLPFP